MAKKVGVDWPLLDSLASSCQHSWAVFYILVSQQLRFDLIALFIGGFQDLEGGCNSWRNLISCQALFAGASLVTTYLVADRSNPSATAVSNKFYSSFYFTHCH